MLECQLTHFKDFGKARARPAPAVAAPEAAAVSSMTVGDCKTRVCEVCSVIFLPYWINILRMR